MKIREKLQFRLAGLGGEAANPDMGDLIMGAFDDTKVKGKLNNLLKDKKIQLVDKETGEAKYEDEIEKAINLQMEDHEEDEDMYSPERKTRTKIEMQETDMVQLENEIKGAIERQKTARLDDEEEKEEFNGHIVEESKEKRPKSGKKGKKSSPKKQDRIEEFDASLNDRVSMDATMKKDELKKVRKEFKEVSKTIKKSLTELKSLNSPPATVIDVVQEACLMVGNMNERQGWKECLNYINREAHLFPIFDPKKMSLEQLHLVNKNDPALVKTKSFAAGEVAHWVNLAMRIRELQ